ncbi:type I polyketide synthase, partial [Dactylosporangium sp. NPDC049525]|uniref:type I polyketide synthase n=1 Tax=Dactylosporangium sp. NPDC049525 TaxID=3154730 RepID=UPI00343616FD
AVGHALHTTRALFEHRAVVHADPADLPAALDRLAAGETGRGVTTGRAAGAARVALLFSGQGAQRPGMGRELHAAFPVFAAALDELCDLLDPHLPRPLRSVMWAAEGTPEAALLDRTEYTQPALFAFEVAMYDLLHAHGVRPGHLIGHSVGELAAACAAGVLSRADAARLVAARGRLMGALPAGGGMLSVRAGLDVVAPLVAAFPGRADVAAVNGPQATVVSGDDDAVAAIGARLAALGHRTRPLRTSHAFHSPLLEPMLAAFRAVAESLSWHEPAIPIVSNVTGALAGPGELTDPEYWVRHARGTVRFCDGVRALPALGVTALIEAGPDTSMTGLARECLPDGDGTLLMAVRRARQPEPAGYLAALAAAHVHGAAVDWTDLHAGHGGGHVALPLYPFQNQRFWLDAPAADATDDRGERPGHPLVDALVELDDGALLYTGRMSLRGQPWVYDHVVFDEIVVPGTTWVELAAWAGRELGCPVVAEFTHESPLLLTPDRVVDLQLRVGAPDGAGRRTLALRCRARDGAARKDWVALGRGALAAGEPVTGPGPDDLAAWPPAGAAPLDADRFYDRHDELGFYHWGASFRSLRRAWRRGEELFAEVRYPDRCDFGGYDLHPAFFDATMHALGLDRISEDLTGLLADRGDSTERPRIPFGWRGVRLHGRGTRSLRVRLTPSAEGTRIAVADEAGRLVATVDAVAMLPVSMQQLKASLTAPRHDALFHLDWSPLPIGDTAPDPGRYAVAGADAAAVAAAAGLPPAAAHPDLSTVAGAEAVLVPWWDGRDLPALLETVQRWLATPGTGPTRLVLLTRGAMAAAPGDTVADPAAAAPWGLLRSAQTEHPDRFVLCDLDDQPASLAALPAVLAAAAAQGEPQLAVRAGQALRPAVVRVPASANTGPEQPLDPAGTVLVTGGTGTLGGLVARHLVTAHGARHLALVSRGGTAPAGLVEELTGLGATVRVHACDIGDRDQVAALLAGIGPDLTAVVHAAGLLDDAVITQLTGEQLARVLRPKVDGARHLHELTRDLPLRSFVLFSAAAGVLGGPGQANYAAANAYLDALAWHRQGLGLPATSLAWGLWAQRSGVTGHLGAADLQRIARSGMRGLSTAEALELFDIGVATGSAALLPAALDPAAIRGAGTVPAILRRLARTAAAPTAPAPAAEAQDEARFADRVAALPAANRHRALVDLVTTHVATVTDHPAHTVDVQRPFRELGFDSLMALELRNRLVQITGLPLPSTLVFDHPTAALLAQELNGLLAPATAAESPAAAPTAAPMHASPTAPAEDRDGAGIELMDADELVRLALG